MSSITGIVQGQATPQAPDRNVTAAAGRIDDRTRNAGSFAPVAAQSLGSAGGAAAGTGQAAPPPPLNATGRGRIVNIVV